MSSALAMLLTSLDRCDRCGAQAYVRATLPSGLELFFCAHHGRTHAASLQDLRAIVHDESSRLLPALIDPGTLPRP